MSDQTREKSGITVRPGRLVLLAAAISLSVVAAVLLWSRPGLPSIEERLAAIEAARAIPDAENAATFYNQLLVDVNATAFDHHPAFLNKDSGNLTLRQPWSEKDYPELADWIEERRWLIDESKTVLQFEECRFPINIDLYTSPTLEHSSMMRKWAFLLARAANNDVGEGRIDGAITKWRCIIRMARHLYQQPTAIDRLMGIALEQLSIGQLAALLVEGDVDENHLKKIESLPLQTRNDWAVVLERIRSVEELAEEKIKEKFSLIDRLRIKLRLAMIFGMGDPLHDGLHLLYVRVVALKRGMHILIALRRHRNEHGCWPESLERIRPKAPAEMLVDPFNKGGFVYKLTGDGFTLYSKGKNNVDEGGQR